MVSKFKCLKNHRTSPLRQPSHKVCLIYVKFEFNLFQSISDVWVRLTLDSRLSSWKCWSVRETRGRRTVHITTQSLFSDPISLGQTGLWLIAWSPDSGEWLSLYIQCCDAPIYSRVLSALHFIPLLLWSGLSFFTTSWAISRAEGGTNLNVKSVIYSVKYGNCPRK